jgi:hypothetical protein
MRNRSSLMTLLGLALIIGGAAFVGRVSRSSEIPPESATIHGNNIPSTKGERLLRLPAEPKPGPSPARFCNRADPLLHTELGDERKTGIQS